ncbi:MAG: hypothetical protein KatS3mg087_0452 [Patescibacteria group bacterium]|nr:MAG: hypothetical protein KatS3mg087_0452 [Patescibacteria group bacterium]
MSKQFVSLETQIGKTVGGDGLIWWSDFLAVPLESITAIPCVERDGKLVPAVRGCRRPLLDAGKFALGSQPFSNIGLARAGWQMDIGGLPVIAFDLDEDVLVKWDGGSEGSATWFFSLLSDLGYGELLQDLVMVSTPSGGYHVYFRDVDLGTETVKERFYRLNPYYKYLKVLPGVEVFLRRPLTVFGSRKGGKSYELVSSPDSFEKLPGLPPALLFVLSGGAFGVLTDEQRAVLQTPKYRMLWEWYLACSQENAGRKKRRDLAAKPSEFYLYAWRLGLLRKDWVQDFLREASVIVYGVDSWRETLAGDYTGRCFFHDDSAPSATFSIKSPEESHVDYLRRELGDAYDDGLGENAHRLIYRCFVCADCATDDSRKYMQQQFYNLMLWYGSWLYDKQLIEEEVAKGYMARLHGLAFNTVGSKWLLNAVPGAVLSTSLLDLDYQKQARRYTRGRSVSAGVSDGKYVGGQKKLQGSSPSRGKSSVKKLGTGSRMVSRVVSQGLYGQLGDKYLMDGFRTIAASKSYESFLPGLPSGYEAWSEYLKSLDGLPRQQLVSLFLDWASSLGLYTHKDRDVLQVVFDFCKRSGIKAKRSWLVGYDTSDPLLGYTTEELDAMIETNGTQESRQEVVQVSGSGEAFSFAFDKTQYERKPFETFETADDYVCDGLIRRKQIVVITGRPGAYKSTVLRNLAAAVSCGGQFLGRRCLPSRVLYAAYDESFEYLLDRLDPLAKRIPLSVRPVAVDVRSPAWQEYVDREFGGDEFTALFEYAVDRNCDVLMVDTLKSLMLVWKRSRVSGRYNDQTEPQAFMDDLRHMASEYDVAVICTDHSPKALERLGDDPTKYLDTSDAVLGHTAYAAGVDAVWYCERLDKGENMARLRSTKCRHKPFDYKLFLDFNAILVYKYQSMFDRNDVGYDAIFYDFDVPYSEVCWRRGVDDIELPTNVFNEIRALKSRSDFSDRCVIEYRKFVPSSSDTDTKSHLRTGSVQAEAPSPTVAGSSATDAGMNRPDRSRIFSYYDDSRVRHARRYILSESGLHDDATVALLHLPDGVEVPDGGRVIRQIREVPKGAKMSEDDWWIDGYLLKFAVDGYRPFSEQNVVDVKYVVFDMETSHVSRKHGRILAIGVVRDDGESVVFDSDDELDIIRAFDEYLLQYDPDWLVGYNILSFDLPYLESRAQAYGYELRFLNKYFRKRHIKYRYGSNYEDVDIYLTRGNLDLNDYARRAVIDLYLLALRHLPDLERYRLVDVVAHFFGEDEARKAQGDKSQMSEWSREMVREQVVGDIIMTDVLLPRLLTAEFFLAQYVPYPFSLLVYSGMGARWQATMTAEYLSRGLALIDAPSPKVEFQGAISECYSTGVFSPVAKVDVASLYPSIIIKHNVHPRSDYQCLLPDVVKGMMEKRLEYKKLAKSGNKFYEGLQWALKILINSAYGFLGAEGVRFADMDAAAKVTAVGRETLEYMREQLGTVGEVLEVDTDGVLVAYRDKSELETIVDAMMRDTGYTMEIDYYQSAVVLAAKNYALLDDGGEIIVHGASLRSRSASSYVQELINELLNRLLMVREESDYDRIIDWLAESAMSFGSVEPERLVERVRISDKTTGRKDLAFLDDELPKVGDVCYIYYEVGRSGRVVRKTLPESINLDRAKYLERYYKSIERFKTVKPFWSRFRAMFGNVERFKSILAGQADLFS